MSEDMLEKERQKYIRENVNSIEMSENMLEKDVRRYVRKNVNRNIR